jgi:hypothetical protein
VKTALALLCLVFALHFSGCAALQPGADPVAVRSEQTVATAFNVFDAFLKLDDANREMAKAKLPAVHAFAEKLRTPVVDNGQQVPFGISLILSANRTRLAYKANRSADNQASMSAALSALARAANEASANLSTLNGQLKTQ